MVADRVKHALAGMNQSSTLELNPTIEKVTAHHTWLVCTSTTGLGEIPQNLRPIFEALEQKQPNLTHIQFALIGLGDRNYKDTYCGGPKKWHRLLLDLKAKEIIAPLFLDATDNPAPDEDACNWVPRFMAALHDHA